MDEDSAEMKEETEVEEKKVEEKPAEPEPAKDHEVKKPSFFKKIDIYIWMIIVLSILAAVGMYSFGWQTLLPQLAVSVVVATITDTVIKYIRTKKFKISKTGIITGLFIGSILGPNSSLEIIALAALLAELLKQLIRYQGRNIFNPALFSLFMLSAVFNNYNNFCTLIHFCSLGGMNQTVDIAWWASASIKIAGYFVPLVVPLGLFISWKYKRFSLTLPSLLVFFVISFLLTGIGKLTLNSIYGTLLNNTLYYFVFLMLVEPKSSPVFYKSRIAYGITAAVLLNFLPILPTFADIGIVGAFIAVNGYFLTIFISNALGRLYERIIK